MTTYMLDLEPLYDIEHTLVFEDEPTIFSEEYAIELIETALHLMEETIENNPTLISEPNFNDILLEELKEIFYIQLEEHILDSDYIEDDMNYLLEDAFNIYITTFYPERSIQNTNEDTDINNTDINNTDNTNNTNDMNDTNNTDDHDFKSEKINIIKNKIQLLRDIPQPVQRTPEWYKFRWNLITASNAWKAFESQSAINQLIYEKCQPLKDFTVEPIEELTKMINTNTPLHWGQKYEPLSVMIYENMYNSKVEDFGCIQHSFYKFIGASPDGIIIESNTGRYGRMLEIKNIVNREINGIPKKEYWIQMQLQMEVCDLDECDFLETKFIEYTDYQSYYNDYSLESVEEVEFNSYVKTKDGSRKGIIIYFHTKEGKPHYEYMPLNLWSSDDISQWEESTLQKYESKPYNYTFLKFIYWKLEKLSCVLVLRNKDWFKNNIEQLENVWKIIEQERITGYEHRAPNKKNKRIKQSDTYFNTKINEETCFLKVIKIE